MFNNNKKGLLRAKAQKSPLCSILNTEKGFYKLNIQVRSSRVEFDAPETGLVNEVRQLVCFLLAGQM